MINNIFEYIKNPVIITALITLVVTVTLTSSMITQVLNFMIAYAAIISEQ